MAWLPENVKKEYAQKAYNKKKADTTLQMIVIARSFGLSIDNLSYWIHKYVDSEFKPGKKGTRSMS